MKKIFSILLLLTCFFAHSQIGQFSPIWTYTGSNIQYTNGSTNTSSLNVNGPETVTGTFSVGSTATLSGSNVFLNNAVPVLNLSSTTYGFGRNNYNEGEVFIRYLDDFSFIDAGQSNTPHVKIKDKMFAINMGTVVPTHTLEVNGNARVSSTFSLGSANLTGGNTGTVAVLSDVVFCTQSSTKPYDPTDGLTIYFANSGYLGLTTNATNNRIYVPKNCTLIGYDITGYTDGSSGTAETSTISIRIDNTTDVTLNSSITYSATYQQWHSMALSTDINAGSYFNLKWVTPTWVTNPTSVINSVVLWFKLR